jgi:hypothetical protein
MGRVPADCPGMTEVCSSPSHLRESRLAKGSALLVVLSLFALVPFVYAHLYAVALLRMSGDLFSLPRGHGIWLAFAVVQVANKVPLAYRYSAGPVLAGLDLVGFSLGLAAAIALGTVSAVPEGLVRTLWFVLVAAWLVASLWHQLNPGSPQNLGVGPGRRLYCAVVATFVPGLPFALAVLAAPAA